MIEKKRYLVLDLDCSLGDFRNTFFHSDGFIDPRRPAVVGFNPWASESDVK